MTHESFSTSDLLLEAAGTLSAFLAGTISLHMLGALASAYGADRLAWALEQTWELICDHPLSTAVLTATCIVQPPILTQFKQFAKNIENALDETIQEYNRVQEQGLLPLFVRRKPS